MARRSKSAQHHAVDRIPEWRLQAAVCAWLDEIGQLYAGSLEGVRLTPHNAQMAKATGMKAGEPDIRLYFDAGRIVFVEMKGEGGSLNKDQRERIPKLYALGFTVHVVKAATPDEAVELVRAIVEAERSTFMGSAVLATRWMPK